MSLVFVKSDYSALLPSMISKPPIVMLPSDSKPKIFKIDVIIAVKYSMMSSFVTMLKSSSIDITSFIIISYSIHSLILFVNDIPKNITKYE